MCIKLANKAQIRVGYTLVLLMTCMSAHLKFYKFRIWLVRERILDDFEVLTI